MVTMRFANPTASALLLGAVLALPVPAEDSARPTEHEVKAAFLYNFAKFVRWPDEGAAGSPFVIAVVGEDPFGAVLDRTLAGKTILDRKVELRRLRDVQGPSGVQILFVSPSEQARLAPLLERLEGAPVLTVGDSEGFAERGGMIEFRVVGDVVRFDINLGQVEKAGLKMSSQLIRLARQVIASKRVRA
jgi:hypothetical protein